MKYVSLCNDILFLCNDILLDALLTIALGAEGFSKILFCYFSKVLKVFQRYFFVIFPLKHIFCIGLDKNRYRKYFSYFSTKTHVVGTHMLWITHNYVFVEK